MEIKLDGKCARNANPDRNQHVVYRRSSLRHNKVLHANRTRSTSKHFSELGGTGCWLWFEIRGLRGLRSDLKREYLLINVFLCFIAGIKNDHIVQRTIAAFCIYQFVSSDINVIEGDRGQAGGFELTKYTHTTKKNFLNECIRARTGTGEHIHVVYHMKTTSTHTIQNSWSDKEAVRFKALYSTVLLS